MSRGKSRYSMNKLVDELNNYGYEVRFEKGNFTSGYCLLEHRKVVVINKFLDVERRVDTLRTILIRVIQEADLSVHITS